MKFLIEGYSVVKSDCRVDLVVEADNEKEALAKVKENTQKYIVEESAEYSVSEFVNKDNWHVVQQGEDL